MALYVCIYIYAYVCVCVRMHVHVYEWVQVCKHNIMCIAVYDIVVCYVGDFKGKAVCTFVMCAHFPDVRTHHSMLHCGWLFPIHTSTNHYSRCTFKINSN